MRRILAGLGLLIIAFVAQPGCSTTDNQIRPPKRVEEYNVPSDTDPRYNRPVEYPKDTLNQDQPKKTTKTTPGLKNNGSPSGRFSVN